MLDCRRQWARQYTYCSAPRVLWQISQMVRRKRRSSRKGEASGRPPFPETPLFPEGVVIVSNRGCGRVACLNEDQLGRRSDDLTKQVWFIQGRRGGVCGGCGAGGLAAACTWDGIHAIHPHTPEEGAHPHKRPWRAGAARRPPAAG